MAAPEKATKINLKIRLKNTDLKDIMPDGWDPKETPVDKEKLLSDLQAEIDRIGVSKEGVPGVSLERITDLPLKLRTTHGANVYKLIGLLQQGAPPAETANTGGDK